GRRDNVGRMHRAHFILQTPHAPAHELVLDEGELAVVGRAPRLDQATEGYAVDATAVRAVEIAVDSVSSNHLRLHAEGDRASIEDLGSSNGTWLLLPRRVRVELPSGPPIVLSLASPRPDEGTQDEPPAVEYRGE